MELRSYHVVDQLHLILILHQQSPPLAYPIDRLGDGIIREIRW
jgi:hypothetical protein